MNVKNLKKKKLSIAFVNPVFIPEYYEGSGKSTLRLISHLKIKDINAFVLAPRLKKETPPESIIENILVKRFKVNNHPNLGGRNIFSFITWSIKLIYWLLTNSNKFDLIHIIHGRLHSVPAIFAAKVLKKPVLVKPGAGGGKHFDVNAVDNKKIIGTFLSQYILKNVSGWVANSSFIVKDLKRHNVRNEFIHKIHNGINIKSIRINKFRKDKTFIVASRLEKVKLCDQIINVFSKIPENLNVKLIILGEGSQRAILEKLTSELNQSHRIIFKGIIKDLNDVNNHLINADFFLSASDTEGMSNSLIESMALGVPAIVSKVSGVEEIVRDNQNGFIFESGNREAFYNKIINAIKYSEEDYIKMSRAASQHILENFSIELTSKKHIELYTSLIKNNF
jgi:glycosyltransferase involved in cell wall biosynthesis